MFASRLPEPSWLDDLNDRQRDAVLHREGPLLVIAGAGTGKTRTLAARVAGLIESGVDADRILLLTFTRRAAADMVRRAAALTDTQGTRRVWGGTFHSIANRLLRRQPSVVGLADGFTVLDQGDAESLFGLVRTDLGIGAGKVRFPRKETINAIYSRVVNAQTKLTDTLDERFPWCREHADELKAIFVDYTNRKREHNIVDYDDLLLYWRALLRSDARQAQRFDHVLVDEYQDTNRIQAEILELMCGPSSNLTVVGDDAQAIYSFRAAAVENILEFPDHYQGARVVTLEQNYRSTPQILDATNAVTGASQARFPKQLWSAKPAGPRPALVTCADPAAEAEYVCDSILELREQGIDLRSQAVLFRTGHHSDAIELELSRRRIPFVKFGGLKFLETAHIKDLLAMLRVLDNPLDDLAWHRMLQCIPGIGPATSRKILVHVVAAATAALDPLDVFVQADLIVSSDARAPLTELQASLHDCRGDLTDPPPPAVQIDRLLGVCRMVFPNRYDNAAARLGDVEALRDLSAEYADRSRFLTELVLDPPNSTSDLAGPPHLDDDYLVLSTIHSAKGGEWEAVFVLHAADGNIPSDLALSEPGGLDEERRIFYVALTRAKQHLHVTVPQRFYHHRNPGSPNHSYALPSRFLTPALDEFDRIARSVDPESGDDVETLPVDPVAPILDALWD